MADITRAPYRTEQQTPIPPCRVSRPTGAFLVANCAGLIYTSRTICPPLSALMRFMHPIASQLPTSPPPAVSLTSRGPRRIRDGPSVACESSGMQYPPACGFPRRNGMPDYLYQILQPATKHVESGTANRDGLLGTTQT